VKTRDFNQQKQEDKEKEEADDEILALMDYGNVGKIFSSMTRLSRDSNNISKELSELETIEAKVHDYKIPSPQQKEKEERKQEEEDEKELRHIKDRVMRFLILDIMYASRKKPSKDTFYGVMDALEAVWSLYDYLPTVDWNTSIEWNFPLKNRTENDLKAIDHFRKNAPLHFDGELKLLALNQTDRFIEQRFDQLVNVDVAVFVKEEKKRRR